LAITTGARANMTAVTMRSGVKSLRIPCVL
jgi:hypothetical protein